MQIASTRQTYRPNTGRALLKPTTTQMSQPSSPNVLQDGWVGASVSVAGGMVTLAGAFTQQPILAAGGTLVTAVGMGLTAHRTSKQGMDTAALVSLGAGSALTLLGAAVLASPAQPTGPNGPLPTFLKQIGVKALPF